MTLHARSPLKADDADAHLSDIGARRLLPAFTKKVHGDARHVPIKPGIADVVITSPPYWLKRDYGVEGQIGQEATAEGYVGSLIDCMENWKTVLPKWGSVFVNIGDTYHNGSLANTPGRLGHIPINGNPLVGVL